MLVYVILSIVFLGLAFPWYAITKREGDPYRKTRIGLTCLASAFSIMIIWGSVGVPDWPWNLTMFIVIGFFLLPVAACLGLLRHKSEFTNPEESTTKG